MRDRLTLAAVLLPLVGVIVLAADAELARAGPSWRIAIDGYDPRDLIHGRYLRYQYRFNWRGAPSCGAAGALDPACCICLSESASGRVDPAARQVGCGEVSGCDGWLRARTLEPPLRYLVPEARAAELEQALVRRDASLELVCDRRGRPRVGELYLDGRPWREALGE